MRLKEYEHDIVIDWAEISHGVLAKEEKASGSPSQMHTVP
jgi:hypothetical protein